MHLDKLRNNNILTFNPHFLDDQVKTTREQEKCTPEQSTNEQKRDIRRISVDATTKSVSLVFSNT